MHQTKLVRLYARYKKKKIRKEKKAGRKKKEGVP